MVNYYSAIFFVTIIFMVMQLVHLHENETLSRKEKSSLQVIAAFIIVGIVCEFVGLLFNGKASQTSSIVLLVKCIEFSIAPCIPFVYCMVVDKNAVCKKLKGFILALLFCNICLEFLSVFYPIIFFINEKNEYVRGNFYFLYILSYFLGIAFFIFIMVRSSKKYQSKNVATLSSMVMFIILGFSIRIVDSNLHTDWLIVAMVYSMFIVYFTDLRLKVDELTSLLNRRSYENALGHISYPTAIILLDANKFKSINDTYGHQCGDAMLKIIADTMLNAYGKYGYCYRIGGDEFVVILKQGMLYELSQSSENFDTYKAIEKLNNNFDLLLSKNYEKYPMLKYGASKGYGIYYGQQLNSFMDEEESRYSSGILSEVVKIADARMYEEKSNFRTE